MISTCKAISATIAATLLLATTSCSLATYGSQEAFTGALGGTVVGSGVGWLIGDQVGNKTENIAVNAAIGGGLGLLAGAVINERNLQVARQREVVIREARLISKTQWELDQMRENLYDSSSWGRNEVTRWDSRYLGEIPNIPFQGNPHYQSPRP